ncbi:hypothetical protein [Mesonia maritima]|uniref:DUF2938 domain-containing protein n=1 Tax=Mesonia maritima TaxID=1793873 RepID=A0ABU1K829_9FLAO|nr:hypothetical protein [Mesonia maritima]MDR6301775.1 hypothetical protein [Mesonia maritima]
MMLFFSSITATIVMTFFSYFYSEVKNEKFKEPQLINILINRLPNFSTAIGKHHILGWLLHFLIGFIFTALFFLIWKYISISWLSGIVLGFFAGLLGVLGWRIAFSVHPNPPEIQFSKFYIQLIVAHILFGLSCVAFLKIFQP